jgi:SM-20-related protein
MPPGAVPEVELQSFEKIATGIRAQGWCHLPDALPVPLCEALLQLLLSSQETQLHRARVGRGKARQVDDTIRRDYIHWIQGETYPEQEYLQWMERLRQSLNAQLVLGLFDFECHFAHYRPGAFYRRHVDTFTGSSNRLISTVLHLNKDWEKDDGGELVIYAANTGELFDTRLVSLRPVFGGLTVFLSEEFPHEVLATRRDRYSIAGWFRINSVR